MVITIKFKYDNESRVFSDRQLIVYRTHIDKDDCLVSVIVLSAKVRVVPNTTIWKRHTKSGFS